MFGWHADAWPNLWEANDVNHLAFMNTIYTDTWYTEWGWLYCWVIQKSSQEIRTKCIATGEVCSDTAMIEMWKRKDWALQKKSQYENVVLCGPRRRSPVAWVNEVISRDGVSCHTSGTGLKIQSPSHVSITGPPRQLTNRSNTRWKMSK